MARTPSLARVAAAWLCQPTTHLVWDGGSKGLPIQATRGGDQGCPLSPAFFAMALAGPLDRIHRLEALASSCRVFSYLDDVMVVAPGGVAESAMDVVIGELQRAGLIVNAEKTAAWSRDPQDTLPERLRD